MSEEPHSLFLFEEPELDFRASLRQHLQSATLRKTFFGTSSWKYEGWLGQIYRPERYAAKGRFSKKRFDHECLEEYAEVFPTVCGDFAFYQFPSPDFWRSIFSRSPSQLRFSFKVPEEISAPVFAKHPRYGSRGGNANPLFLDRAAFKDLFVSPLLPYANQTAVLIFEFGAVCGELFAPADFINRLSRFLDLLPASFRYAVEIRNAEFLEEMKYVDILRAKRVAHVFNAWSRMPPLSQQIQIPGIFTTDLTVVRALLKRGRNYDEAVRLFAPYQSIQERDPDVRRSIRDIVIRTQKRGETAYIYVNNRLEGNAPATIHEILDDVESNDTGLAILAEP